MTDGTTEAVQQGHGDAKHTDDASSAVPQVAIAANSVTQKARDVCDNLNVQPLDNAAWYIMRSDEHLTKADSVSHLYY